MKGLSLEGRRHDTVKACALAQARKPKDMLLNRFYDAGFGQCVACGTCQDRYGHDQRPSQRFFFAHIAHFIDDLPHHFVTARGMNVEHPNAEPGSFDAGPRDRVWNVVKFQVQEDPVSGVSQPSDKLRSGGGKKLQPYLVSVYKAAKFIDYRDGVGLARDIERNYESVSGRRRRCRRRNNVRHYLVKIERVLEWRVAGRVGPF
jgi:hypothetical protein